MPQAVDVRVRVKARDLPSPGAEGFMTRSWPLWNFFEVGAYPQAAACARLHARHVLWEWLLHDVVDATELVVSELVTNSIKASQELTGCRYEDAFRPGRPPVRLWLHTDRERLLISVWDGNDQMPALQEAGPDDEQGRGLFLVEQFSDTWGAYNPSRESGKVTWALLSVRERRQNHG